MRRSSSVTDCSKEPVRRFGRAGERPREDLRVRHDESLLASHRGAGETGERDQIRRVERATGSKHGALRRDDADRSSKNLLKRLDLLWLAFPDRPCGVLPYRRRDRTALRHRTRGQLENWQQRRPGTFLLILDPQLLDRHRRIAIRVRRERNEADVPRVEFRLVLLEVSQLLTAVASPVSPVEEQDGRVTLQVLRQTEASATNRQDFEIGEATADFQGLHTAASAHAGSGGCAVPGGVGVEALLALLAAEVVRRSLVGGPGRSGRVVDHHSADRIFCHVQPYCDAPIIPAWLLCNAVNRASAHRANILTSSVMVECDRQ